MGKIERVRESFKLKIGNYSSTLSILKVIASWFKDQFPSDDDDDDDLGETQVHDEVGDVEQEAEQE